MEGSMLYLDKDDQKEGSNNIIGISGSYSSYDAAICHRQLIRTILLPYHLLIILHSVCLCFLAAVADAAAANLTKASSICYTSIQ